MICSNSARVVIAAEHSWGLDRELIAAETKNINGGLTLGLVQ
jgi:hypothetical protein